MRIGILGGGQLARMLILAGTPLGFSFRIYDSAVRSATKELAPYTTGEFDDRTALSSFAKEVDLVTAEFENIPAEVYEFLSESVPCFPSPNAIASVQDRLNEKEIFVETEIPTAPFQKVDTKEDLTKAIDELGLPLVIKRRRMGYDGKGQWRIRSAEEINDIWSEIDSAPCIAESFVTFSRELSIIAVCGRDGSKKFYPLVENVHKNKILHTSLAPAKLPSPELQKKAEACATRLADKLGYVGVIVLELFDNDGELMANECAPRVHNSGHWSIEGSITSQFENHIRAVSDLPLGSTEMTGVALMRNFIGEMPNRDELLKNEAIHLHDYVKEAQPGRKLGHGTIVVDSYEELDQVSAPLVDLIP